MKNEIASAKIDHSADFVIRENKEMRILSTWFYAEVDMNDEMTGLRKAGILVQLVAFAEWLGFECNDVCGDDGYYPDWPVIIDDGEAIDVEDFLEDHEDKLVKFLADDNQFNNQTWVLGCRP